MIPFQSSCKTGCPNQSDAPHGSPLRVTNLIPFAGCRYLSQQHDNNFFVCSCSLCYASIIFCSRSRQFISLQLSSRQDCLPRVFTLWPVRVEVSVEKDRAKNRRSHPAKTTSHFCPGVGMSPRSSKNVHAIHCPTRSERLASPIDPSPKCESHAPHCY